MNSDLKRVGLLGGTFDPVHNGHLDLAAETAKIFNLQKVFFIPVSRSPHKLNCHLTPSSHRVAMLELALAKETTFSIDPLEIKKGGVSYTVDTLSCLKEQHPDWELFLILGADAFLVMNTWKSSSEILKLCHILVGTRPGFKLEISKELGQALRIKTKQLDNNDLKLQVTLYNCIGKAIQLYQIPTQNISSRKIRHRVQVGKEIKNLLPLAVDRYIMRHQLYRTEPPPIMV